MSKKRVESESTTFAGITLKETITTYERDTFCGIPYGEERKVKEETNYLKFDESTKEIVKDGVGIVADVLVEKANKKLLPYKK